MSTNKHRGQEPRGFLPSFFLKTIMERNGMKFIDLIKAINEAKVSQLVLPVVVGEVGIAYRMTFDEFEAEFLRYAEKESGLALSGEPVELLDGDYELVLGPDRSV